MKGELQPLSEKEESEQGVVQENAVPGMAGGHPYLGLLPGRLGLWCLLYIFFFMILRGLARSETSLSLGWLHVIEAVWVLFLK